MELLEKEYPPKLLIPMMENQIPKRFQLEMKKIRINGFMSMKSMCNVQGGISHDYLYDILPDFSPTLQFEYSPLGS